MADEGKTTTCCQRASDEDIRLNPEVYDCSNCPLMLQLTGLWPENAEAWDLYKLLCGRTARDLGLASLIFERWTAGWTTDRMVTLMDRLNLIASVLEPHGAAQDRPHR